MRNLFDQYSQPENRLTHALISSLNEDRALLQRFVRWASGRKIDGRKAELYEQSLPGDRPDLAEDESRGLPDACILDKVGWLLLIETKFQADVGADQLRRHIRTAGRRGYPDCQVLVLTVRESRQRLPKSVLVKKWTDVYEWLQQQSFRSHWAALCRTYLEIAEAREVANEYFDEGTLTTFSGIPFGPDDPYTYQQAKRVLGLFRDTLLQDRRLERGLGADLSSPGRGAITGRNANGVWDYIGLKHLRSAKVFTQYPHLTIGVMRDRLEVYVTVPNGIRSRLRSSLLGPEYAQFEKVIETTTRALGKAIIGVHGAVPMIVVVQRHFLSQRSEGIHDCQLRFDPRTAVSTRKGGALKVKRQPQWLQAAYDALRHRRSNLQFQIGVEFAYDKCRFVSDKSIAKVAADVWLACRPIIDATTE